MPDRDGYEILSGSVYAAERPRVLHHPCDTYVDNDGRAKREHLRACRRQEAARERERAAARDRERGLIAAQLTIGSEEA